MEICNKYVIEIFDIKYNGFVIFAEKEYHWKVAISTLGHTGKSSRSLTDGINEHITGTGKVTPQACINDGKPLVKACFYS